jgi:hypothetical protein
MFFIIDSPAAFFAVPPFTSMLETVGKYGEICPPTGSKVSVFAESRSLLRPCSVTGLGVGCVLARSGSAVAYGGSCLSPPRWTEARDGGGLYPRCFPAPISKRGYALRAVLSTAMLIWRSRCRAQPLHHSTRPRRLGGMPSFPWCRLPPSRIRGSVTSWTADSVRPSRSGFELWATSQQESICVEIAGTLDGPWLCWAFQELHTPAFQLQSVQPGARLWNFLEDCGETGRYSN